jgi:hypothetical protein
VFAEVVVMLPFFIIVWASVIFVHNYFSARIRLGAKAKSCAWQYANDGCRQTPAGCDALSVSSGSDLETSELPEGGALNTLANNPIMRAASRIVLGSNADVSGSDSTARPAPLGSGSMSFTVRNTVMCNEIPRTPGQVAHDAFCGMTHLC